MPVSISPLFFFKFYFLFQICSNKLQSFNLYRLNHGIKRIENRISCWQTVLVQLVQQIYARLRDLPLLQLVYNYAFNGAFTALYPAEVPTLLKPFLPRLHSPPPQIFKYFPTQSWQVYSLLYSHQPMEGN